jgi:uncharacterized membrane protein YkoI
MASLDDRKTSSRPPWAAENEVMKRLGLVSILLIATVSLAAAATTHHATKVSKAAARKTALAAVPGGKVKAAELEKENGRLIYSFDITVPGKSGIEEVQVDAHTGKVVSQTHESAKKEAHEQAQEKAEGKADTTAH